MKFSVNVNRCFLLILIPQIFGCGEKKVDKSIEYHSQNDSLITAQKDTVQNETRDKNVYILSDDLIDIQQVSPSIKVDLKYASEDNFMKQRLYFQIDKLYLQKDVAVRLAKVQSYLKELNPKLSLLVYDGTRPLSVQQKMWDALDTIPVEQRTKFVSNPANGSLHNYGAAVDLTICNTEGTPLDMGAGYDDIREIAYPQFESLYLSRGELTLEQIAHRKLLRKVMRSQGFRNIPTEWWHFNACSREEAKKKYVLVK